MGTFLSVTLSAKDSEHLSEIIDEAKDIVNIINNDTGLFNVTKPFERLSLSYHFYNLYFINKLYYELSGGLFDPTAFTVAKLYGFPSGEFHTPTLSELSSAKAEAGFYNIIEDNGTFYKKTNVFIDFGATGKGYIVDLISISLKAKGVKDFIINAGGDIFISGKKGEKPFTIGVLDPKNRVKPLTTVQLKDKGVATSGNYERFFIDGDNKSINHIFKGVTFESVNSYSSLSVIAENALLADTLATLYYLLDIDEVRRLCAKFQTPVLILDNDNNEHTLCGWQ